jgi:hypothetical protein
MRRGALVRTGAIAAMSALVIVTAAAGAGASVPAKATPFCAGKTKAAAAKAIKKTWDIFLNGTVGREIAAREAYVEGADDPELKKLFEDTFVANAAVAATTSTKVNSVKCTGKKTADVAYDLVLAGTVTPGIAPPGTAHLAGKTWKVTTQTVCDLVSLANPAALESGPCAG